MKEFENARVEYENLPIPGELNDLVQAGIRQGKANYRRNARVRKLRRSLSTLAACFAVLVVTLNLSPTVAAAAADVPVLGGLFQVLTVRSFATHDGDKTVQVDQPAVENGGAVAEAVNREIQERVDAKIAEGEQMVEEYKAGFFASGGTQADWEQHNNEVHVSYAIKSRTDTTVSFVVDTYIAIASTLGEQFYYNLDLANDKELTLRDLLGEDWVTICNDAIRRQIEERETAGNLLYFGPEDDGFVTVDEETAFYIRPDGVPVVVFPKYAIAAGAAGSPEFPIQR